MTTLTICDPIITVNPTNEWHLNISCMSGDGDHYENATLVRKTSEEIILLLNVLDVYNGIGWNQQCDISRHSHWATLGGFSANDRELTEQQAAFNDIADAIPSDVQSDGDWMASPSSWTVHYYDAAGIQHHVAITDSEGKPAVTYRR